MMLQEGQRAITQATLDHGVKARGPGCPQVNPPAQEPFTFNVSRTSPPGDKSAHYGSDEMDGPLDGPPEAVSVTEEGETRDHGQPGFHPLLQTGVSKAIKVHYPWCLQYHPSQITQMDLDILDKAGGIKKKPA